MPRFAVGIVIGRNGEMIKKIQNDAGVRIQFKPGQKLSKWLLCVSVLVGVLVQSGHVGTLSHHTNLLRRR